MSAITRDQLVANTKEFMDAEFSVRWSPTVVQAVCNAVHDGEWSEILTAAPTYTFAQRSVTSDSNGQVTLTDLNSGTGDSQQLWYRILTVDDGTNVYGETRFQDVPLARGTIERGYYLVGDILQLLPRQAVALTVSVNYKPTSVSALASGASIVTFPENSEWLLAYEAAATLLLKGGAESGAAADLKRLAEGERSRMLNDLRRRTINPTRLSYPDGRSDWAGA